MGAEQETVYFTGSFLCLEGLDGPLQILDLIQLSMEPVRQLLRLCLQHSTGLKKHLLVLFHLLEASLTGDGLNTADTGSHTAFTLQFKGANFGGIIQVRTAAQLDGVVTHVDDPNLVTVLFTKQCGGAHLLCFFDGHLTGHNAVTFQHSVLNNGIDLYQFLRGQRGIMSKVKTQMVRFHQRTGLVDMVTQDAHQGLLQQVGSGVSSHDSLTTLHINRSTDDIVHLDGTGDHCTMV